MDHYQTNGVYRDFAGFKGLALNKHGIGPFCRFVLRGLPINPGVYALTVNGDEVYVGKCINLAIRFGLSQYGAIQPKNCYRGGQSTNCKVNNLVLQYSARNSRIDLWFHATDRPSSIEASIIKALRPPWNGQVS
jgi:excinuclease UvrABC nuclease subunit